MYAVFAEVNLRCNRDLEARKEIRDQAWKLEGWSETVSKVLVLFSLIGSKKLTGTLADLGIFTVDEFLYP